MSEQGHVLDSWRTWPHSTRTSAVALQAALFVCVDIACNLFERRVFAGEEASRVSGGTLRMASCRSLVVLAIFTDAARKRDAPSASR